MMVTGNCRNRKWSEPEMVVTGNGRLTTRMKEASLMLLGVNYSTGAVFNATPELIGTENDRNRK